MAGHPVSSGVVAPGPRTSCDELILMDWLTWALCRWIVCIPECSDVLYNTYILQLEYHFNIILSHTPTALCKFVLLHCIYLAWIMLAYSQENLVHVSSLQYIQTDILLPAGMHEICMPSQPAVLKMYMHGTSMHACTMLIMCMIYEASTVWTCHM